MMSVLFPDLEQTGLLRPHAAMVESSRFCVDTSMESGRAGRSVHDVTLTMFAASIEWSIRHLQGFVGTLQVDGYAGYKVSWPSAAR